MNAEIAPSEKRTQSSKVRKESIILGGGCFWCTEAVMRMVPGVRDVVSGYAGGVTKKPTYEDVSTGKTGHAEVVQVNFDQSVISLKNVLKHFFAMHDPTSVNRQGNDIGTQYRSIILWTDQKQKPIIESVVREITGDYTLPIATEVKELTVFYPAEDYHQRYFEKNPDTAYCRIVIAPKVEKTKKMLGRKGVMSSSG